MNIFNEKELIYYIDNYETKFSDKRERGSVFTNSNLINKMLNKLPKKVWKNPDLKWLDPGCGIGNFHIIVYFRLMKSLPIENEEMKTDMSRRSQSLIDDKGTQRVANGILEHYGYN